MCHCITPQALLAGLVRRIEHDGYVPTESDLRALAGSGCGVNELRATIARAVSGPTADRLLASLPAR